jgi:protein-L-isoaspartate(D-aspartate) O-methyltransferase
MIYSYLILILSLLFIEDISQDSFRKLREDMVKYQIEDRNVHHKATLEAMRKVPRHEFVPLNMQAYAYADRPLSIGNGQTISQPYIVAFMTSVIDPGPDDKVLEIGTGSGYQAAVLAEIVKDVYTIEIIPELAERANEKFKALHYNNIHTRVGDGYHGWPDASPFDAIIVTAAPNEIPDPLIDQLKEGGKLVIPVGPRHSVQYLQLVTKKNGKPKVRNLLPVRFVPFTRD